MEVLGLIIARGGSQRVPDKNIKPLGGRPLLAYSIEAAKRSRHISRVIVSTDSESIAQIAIREGAEAPFRRPAEISQGHSTELEAVEHALAWLREHESYEPDLVTLLRPTTPFRKSATIDRAIELLLNDPAAHSVRTVKLCSEHPHKMWVMDKEGRRIRSFVHVEQKPREAHTLSYHLLPIVYVQNASMDVLRPSNIWDLRSTTGTEIIPLVMDEMESVDINTHLDFFLAETLMGRTPLGKRVGGRPDLAEEKLERYAKYLTVERHCLVCSERQTEMWASWGPFQAIRCIGCGLVWINPHLNKEGLRRYYTDYIGLRAKDQKKTEQRQRQYELDRDFIQTYVTSGKVLDVGCSGGFFLNVLNQEFEKHGIEIDEEAVRYAREHFPFGDNVLCRALEEAPYAASSFDLVVMRGVIEHLSDPVAAIAKVGSLLKPGGCFFVSATPNVGSFCADLYREKWNQFHPVRHLWYFSVATLSRLCERADLKLVAKDFPYLETPYAEPEGDHVAVLRAVQAQKKGRWDEVEISPPFWGNMMSLIYRKVA